MMTSAKSTLIILSLIEHLQNQNMHVFVHVCLQEYVCGEVSNIRGYIF